SYMARLLGSGGKACNGVGREVGFPISSATRTERAEAASVPAPPGRRALGRGWNGSGKGDRLCGGSGRGQTCANVASSGRRHAGVSWCRKRRVESRRTRTAG